MHALDFIERKEAKAPGMGDTTEGYIQVAAQAVRLWERVSTCPAMVEDFLLTPRVCQWLQVAAAGCTSGHVPDWLKAQFVDSIRSQL